MKKFITLIALLFWSVTVFAQTHTVARGESLQSIAAKYNVTEAQLIAANPGADKLFYVGLKLNIPESINGVTQKDTNSYIKDSNSYINEVSGNKPQSVAKQNSDNRGGRIDSSGELVLYHLFVEAQYQMTNFKYAKESSWYGLGISATSLSHWGALHVGANLNFSLNAGIQKEWGLLFDFGPSVRFDLAERFFINMPVDVMCICSFPESKGREVETSWGGKLSPAIHAFFTDKIGIYVGPQLHFGFQKGSKAAFGMVAGISYEF